VSKGIQKQVRVLPAIETEGHLFAVGLEMLRANLVPRSHYSALEQGERGFDSVRLGVAIDVNLELVANRLVASIFPQMLCRASVGFPIVCVQNLDISTQVFADILFQRPALYIFRVKESEIAATLPQANRDFLVFPAMRSALANVPTADKGFVHFHLTIHHWLINFDHSRSDAVAEVPRGLVAHTKSALDLTGRLPFLGFTEQQGSHKPLAQGQVRIIEDRTSGNTELVVATGTVEELLFGSQFDCVLFAAKAAHAIGKAETGQQFAASFVSREARHYVGQIHTHRETPNGREEKRAA
jgi:hypothetical protein